MLSRQTPFRSCSATLLSSPRRRSSARLQVNITETQANELLSRAATRNQLLIEGNTNTAVIRQAVLIIASAVGGQGLYSSVSEHLAGEFDSTRARAGILPPVN